MPLSITLTRMLKTIEVVAAIIERDNKILIARRPQSGDQPGLWEFPGGKVEPGESQPDALIRELREELGIEALPAAWVASHRREVSGRLIHLHAWHVPAYRGDVCALAHSALAWVSAPDALKYALAPADVPLLEAFMALRAARPAD